MLRELLSRNTDREVQDAKNGLVPVKDKIYICPPNKNITVHNGVIRLSDPNNGVYYVKPSIDLFFDSLSESVITSYSIHYTKLYERDAGVHQARIREIWNR